MMQNCMVCGQDFIADSIFCKQACKSAYDENKLFLDHLAEQKPNLDDQRVFFYDIGFGKLCDLSAIYLLRYFHENSLALRKETLFHIDKIQFAIMTKLNRSMLPKDIKQKISKRLEDLLFVNGKMWRLRERLQKILNGDPDYQDMARNYFTLSNRRDAIRNELDMLIEGRIRIARSY